MRAHDIIVKQATVLEGKQQKLIPKFSPNFARRSSHISGKHSISMENEEPNKKEGHELMNIEELKLENKNDTCVNEAA